MDNLISFDWLYLIGTVSFSISGYLIGAHKQFDILGITILALLTAIGGGLLRDALIGRMPLVFINAGPVMACFATLSVAWLIKLHRHSQLFLRRAFIIADSIGLVAFSIAGAQVGIGLELNLFGVAFLGFITAVGGGLVRDMMVNEVPFILHRDFYGTVSILVAVMLYGAAHLGAADRVTHWALFLFGLALRLIAHSRDMSLPRADK
ncbi:trimeric intracellular cation channel family protein [Uliginosibacterium sp. TH139]|uniref:trimeric intracellular cation channel family protein n=1 Tax=Uliginosibacterium sp. TH139 TaxID=2067453 RepID=UPI001C200372|nr:trimeric intracellular cation channel family protein [Uliginosibacterium sp. TH139]